MNIFYKRIFLLTIIGSLLLPNVLFAKKGISKVEVISIQTIIPSEATSGIGDYFIKAAVGTAVVAASEFVADGIIGSDGMDAVGADIFIAGSKVGAQIIKYSTIQGIDSKIHEALDEAPDQLKAHLAWCQAGVTCDKNRHLGNEPYQVTQISEGNAQAINLTPQKDHNIYGEHYFKVMHAFDIYAPKQAYNHLFTVDTPNDYAENHTHGSRVAYIGLEEYDCPGPTGGGCDNDDVNDDLGTIHIYSFNYMSDKYLNDPGSIGNGKLEFINDNYTYVRTVEIYNSQNKSKYRVKYKLSRDDGECSDLNIFAKEYYNKVYPQSKCQL
ncbi:MAG: hypothetical protein AB8B80_17300 [Marinicellaceae bacterium]